MARHSATSLARIPVASKRSSLNVNWRDLGGSTWKWHVRSHLRFSKFLLPSCKCSIVPGVKKKWKQFGSIYLLDANSQLWSCSLYWLKLIKKTITIVIETCTFYNLSMFEIKVFAFFSHKVWIISALILQVVHCTLLWETLWKRMSSLILSLNRCNWFQSFQTPQ